MDNIKKNLEWNEEKNVYIVNDKQGNVTGMFTVDGMRKLAKDQAEKQATPEYIKKFKEKNKRKTEIKKNIQRRASNITSMYQNINDKLETRRQVESNIKESQDKIVKIKGDLGKLDTKRLEHIKYMYKIETKLDQEHNTLQQRRVDNILAIDRDTKLEMYRIDEGISKQRQIDLQIQQHSETLEQADKIYKYSSEQRQQQHSETVKQAKQQHAELLEQQLVATEQAAKNAENLIKENQLTRDQANKNAEDLRKEHELAREQATRNTENLIKENQLTREQNLEISQALSEQNRLEREQNLEISQAFIKNQEALRQQEKEVTNGLLQKLTENNAEVAKGLGEIGTKIAEVGANIKNAAITSNVKLEELVKTQITSAEVFQNSFNKANKPITVNLTPSELRQFCKGGCENNYAWNLYQTGVTNQNTGVTGIIIWRCSGGAHFCASDIGSLPYNRFANNMLHNYKGPTGIQLYS